MHTPQNGLTERSLSLHLSLCEASEVTPQWQSSPFLQGDSMNLLLIPWPFEVLVNQFRETADTGARRSMRAHCGLPATFCAGDPTGAVAFTGNATMQAAGSIAGSRNFLLPVVPPQ